MHTHLQKTHMCYVFGIYLYTIKVWEFQFSFTIFYYCCRVAILLVTAVKDFGSFYWSLLLKTLVHSRDL